MLCLSITIFLPLVTYMSVNMIDEQLYERSESTPVLVGSKGSPFLLTFNSIYFKTEIKEKLEFGAYEELKSSIKGKVIPLHTFHTAKGIPIVGTSFDYFGFRGLSPAQGTLPQMLGDAVLGSNAAESLRTGAGGSVVSDCESIYDISAEYPLKMRITGVLAPTGTPDDNVVFVSIKTAWIIDGIGHGHEELVGTLEEMDSIDLSDPGRNPDDSVLFIESSEIVYNSRLKKFNEITHDNINTFHFHGDVSGFPLSALIVLPASYEEEVVKLLAELNLTRSLQAVRPTRTVEEILAILLDIKRLLDGFSILVLISTAAFMILVIWLQIRQRKGEMLILDRMGGGKHAMKALLLIEVTILVLTSACLAFAGSAAATSVIRSFICA